jgi:proteasome accessory factor B
VTDSQNQREREDAGERLLSLTISLLRAGQYGLKKDELQQSVRDYRNQLEDFAKGRSKATSLKTLQDALDKKMGRDLDTLRESGIPVRVEIPAKFGNDNTETRYFIAKDEFVWPDDVTFSARQIQLLQLANKVWSNAAIGATTNSSMSRIRALGPSSMIVDLQMIAPKLRIHHPSFMPLTAAAENGKLVSFQYRKPSAEAVETRTVQPWRLESISGQWLLVAFDPAAGEAGDLRNFLLKRITGQVQILEESFKKPTELLLNEALKRLDDHVNSQIATIRAPKGTLASAHFNLEDSDSDLVSFNYMDLALLAEELREIGPSAEVLEPKELREAIRKGLEKVASDHA